MSPIGNGAVTMEMYCCPQCSQTYSHFWLQPYLCNTIIL